MQYMVLLKEVTLMPERNNHPDQQSFSLIKGPFVVDLRIPHSEGIPEWRGRFILGGGKNAELQVRESLDQINQLPDGLSPDELRQSAGIIFSSNGLLRVDF